MCNKNTVAYVEKHGLLVLCFMDYLEKRANFVTFNCLLLRLYGFGL